MAFSNRSIAGKKKQLKNQQLGKEWDILSGFVSGLFTQRKLKKAEKKAAQSSFLEEVEVISKKGFQFKENAPIFIQVGAMAAGLVISRVVLSKFRPKN